MQVSDPTKAPSLRIPEDRWEGICRPYSAAEVERLRGSVHIEHTLARLGANRLWDLLLRRDHVHALGAMTGGQAVQMARAGLEAIYCSGWQVAADANLSAQTYPDQSLYPANSVPQLVKRLNAALQRADQVEHAEQLKEHLAPDAAESLFAGSQPPVAKLNGKPGAGNGVEAGRRDHHVETAGSRNGAMRAERWFLPIVADAEAGFGGPLNAFELMKAMIEAGAAGVHFEDQLSSEKKCGHLGGKVLVPIPQFIRTLVAARLAADVLDVPTVIIARTDAQSAQLLTSEIDPCDRAFCTGERTPEGFHRVRGGNDYAIARALAYAPYADLLWCETSTPDLEEARRFAEAVRAEHPHKLLAYNCSPSFNWKQRLDDATITRFQRELGAMGYRFQFVTLAGFHQLNYGMFELALGYKQEGMSAYVRLQQDEFAAEALGYTATRHQREVGTSYFDAVMQILSGGTSSTTALEGSTENEQFGR